MHPEQHHQASVMSFDYTFDQYEPHFSLLLSPSQKLQSLPDTINTPPDRTIMRRTFQESRPNTSNCSESHYKERRGEEIGEEAESPQAFSERQPGAPLGTEKGWLERVGLVPEYNLCYWHFYPALLYINSQRSVREILKF